VIVRSIRLHPFAGVADATFAFEPQLNVVVGPNEAGKSTIVNALRTVLLEPTEVRKSTFEKELERFVPSEGGKSFSVTIEFDQAKQPYRLTKTWGSVKRTELVTPNGHAITSASDAQKTLLDLLTIKPGTWDRVLFSQQNHLATTLKRLESESDQKEELADLLRAAVMATDGVSIDKLQTNVRRIVKQLCSRWDEGLIRPEGNRGIQNPWKQEVGSILAAWYSKERAARNLADVKAFEYTHDEIAQSLSEASHARSELQAYVDQWRPIAQAANKRSSVEARWKLAVQEETNLKKVNQEWPTLEERKRNRTEEQRGKSAILDSLQAEFRAIETYNQAQGRRDAWERISRLIAEKERLQNEASLLKKIDAKDLQALKGFDSTERDVQARLESAKLRIKIQLSGDESYTMQRGSLPASSLERSEESEADGRVVVFKEGFRIEVTAGQIDFLELESILKRTRTQREQFLSKLFVGSLEEAQSAMEAGQKSASDLQSIEKLLARELNGRSIESLKPQEHQQIDAPKRSLTDVQRELGIVQAECSQAVSELRSVDARLAEWISVFGTMDELLDKLQDVRKLRKELEEDLHAMPNLPDEVDSIDRFMQQFEAKEIKLRELSESTIPELKERKAALGNGPELTWSEAEIELQLATIRFEQECAKLKAMRRVESTLARLQQEMDGGTLDPWLRSLRDFLTPMTSGHYVDLDVDKAIVQRGSTLTLSYDHLSMGTKTCLGLAIRLSMAKHFLDGNDGFIVLDDPMVDLDANRQSLVAQVLRDFAETWQVIVLTCHAHHADLLGGNRIELARLYK
jgi:DNA repair protein SbcC/Rad50